MRKRRKEHTGTLGDAERETFLACLEAGMLVRDAAEVCGVSRTALYQYRKDDPEFFEEWEAAYCFGADIYAKEAVRRGLEGVKEPVFYMGREIARVAKYSDTLLMMMMKSRDPSRYCDRARTLELEAARAAREAENGKTDPTAHAAAMEAIAALERLAAAKAATATDTTDNSAPCPTDSD